MTGPRRQRLSRRALLVAGGGVAVAIALGAGTLAALRAPARRGLVVNAFLALLENGDVEFVCPAMNVGQGAPFALAMILAEELGADPVRVVLSTAPRDPGVYGNPDFDGRMVTADSKTTRGYWAMLRLAGAEGRLALVATACRIRGWRPGDCTVTDHAVRHGPTGTAIDFAAIARSRSLQLPGAALADLKPATAFALVGASPANPEHEAIVTGRKRYGIDHRDGDMAVAVLAVSPHLGGRVVSFDGAGARLVSGVEAVVGLDDAVAVVARDTWSALNGRRALDVRWSTPGDFDTDAGARALSLALDDPGRACVVLRDSGITDAPPTLEGTFHAPCLSHVLPEPLNASARATHAGLGVAVAGSTQSLDLDMRYAAQTWKTAPLLVSCTGHPSGGAYGRRVLNDAVRDAARITKALGRPVQVVRPLLDELRRGQVRPAALQRIVATLDGDGMLAGWQHDFASDGTLATHLPSSLKGPGHDEDNTATDGATHPYRTPRDRIRWTRVASAPQPGFLRGVSAGYTVWAIEVMVERLARRAGQDPVAWRLRHLDDGRLANVLRLAAASAGWGEPGRHLGAAITAFRGSAVASVAEVADGAVRGLWIAADLGQVVHRDQAFGQIEGGAVWGLSMALVERLDHAAGRAKVDSLADYPILRADALPPIRIALVDAPAGVAPGGAGEIGVPTVIPAVCNAFEAATGRSFDRLPLTL